MEKLHLAYLYPDYLNLYGDRGNIICLRKRAIWHGFDFEVDRVSIGDKLDPDKYDLIFMGGGQDSDQQLIYDDLIQDKGDQLRQAIDKNIVTLCICGGYQLMGHRYVDHQNHEMKGLGILDIETIAETGRYVGDLIFETHLPVKNNILLGFENHGGRTYLGPKAKPMGKVLVGAGNNGKDQTEGVYYKNLFGTYAHGSFLPRNPDMADYLLQLAVKRKGFVWPRNDQANFNEFVDSARQRIFSKYKEIDI